MDNEAGIVIQVCYQHFGMPCVWGGKLAWKQTEDHAFEATGNNNIVNVFYEAPPVPSFVGGHSCSGMCQLSGCYFTAPSSGGKFTVTVNGTLGHTSCKMS